MVLGVAVALGTAYSAALAFLVPANDGDALAYHLTRAAFWKQEHGLGYIAGVLDRRLNVNPPNGEIGQLATMVLTDSDRYVVLPQLAAYGALVLAVVALGRRLGLDAAGALFGAIAFASLSIVAVQASSALNDLVVASFLATAAVFALRSGRASLVPAAIALGLAVGTKFTALLALPTLAVVIAVGRPVRHWPALVAAGAGALVLGSTWYVVNLVETGELDGGLAEAGEQRVEASASAMVTNTAQLSLDVVDMSGAAKPHWVLFPLVGLALAGLGLRRLRRSRRDALAFVAAGAVTAAVILSMPIEVVGQRALDRGWAVFGKPEFGPFEGYLELNYTADAVASWYGPLGALVLLAAPVAVVALRLRERAPSLALAYAFAPWILLLTLGALLVWDPFRGRFLLFPVALAAAAWGLLFASPVARRATAAVGTTALALTLANNQGKPSGLAELWSRDEIHFVSAESIWGTSRPEALARLRPDEGEEAVYRYLEENIPTDAAIAFAPRSNDFLSPFFGPRLSRHVSLASRTRDVPAMAEWLVLAPAGDARRCRTSWRREVTHGSGWRIERRIAADTCPASPHSR